jgi:transposase
MLQKVTQASEVCRRPDAIPGIGPLTATALVSAIGNGAAFIGGGSSQPGLVLREHPTAARLWCARSSRERSCYASQRIGMSS